MLLNRQRKEEEKEENPTSSLRVSVIGFLLFFPKENKTAMYREAWRWSFSLVTFPLNALPLALFPPLIRCFEIQFSFDRRRRPCLHHQRQTSDFSDLNFVPSPTLFPNQLPTTSLLVAALSKISWSQGLANQPGSIFLLLHPHTQPLGTRRKRKLGRPSRTHHYYSPYYSLFFAFSIAPLPSASPCIYARHIRYRPEEAIHTHSLPLPYLTRFLSPSPFWPFSPNTRKQRRKEDGSGKKGGLRDGF